MTDRKPSLLVDPSLYGAPIRAALVWGLGLPGCPPTGEIPDYIEDLLTRVRAVGDSFLAPERKAAVRDMIRFGKYKPAGRSKPSSEYLLAVALAGDLAGDRADETLGGAFPLVNGPVDANNAASLEWGYPASVFDLALAGSELLLRRGAAGERYVFNPSGQEIELEDLLVACRRAPGGAWEPCGNPVKDAMATKVFDSARDVAAIVYAPASDPEARLGECAARFAELLSSRCGAREAGYALVDAAAKGR